MIERFHTNVTMFRQRVRTDAAPKPTLRQIVSVKHYSEKKKDDFHNGYISLMCMP